MWATNDRERIPVRHRDYAEVSPHVVSIHAYRESAMGETHEFWTSDGAPTDEIPDYTGDGNQ